MSMRRVLLRFDTAADPGASPARAALRRTVAWLCGAAPPVQARAGLAVLALTALLAAALTWQTQQAITDMQEQAQRLAALQARSAGRRPATAAAPSPRSPDIAALVAATRQLNTPWSALLDTLEQSLPPQVALVSIEPDARDGGVRLQAQARTLDSLLAYARVLADAPGVTQAVPLQHETLEQDPARAVRMTLQLRLSLPTGNGATP